MIAFGNIPAGSVLPVFFDTFAGSTGASITLTGLAVTDIEVYRGTSMTQRASDAGYALIDTDGIDIDSITGIHGFSIDTGDNTDASFYGNGAFYTVVVSAITVDGQTVNFIAATFRLLGAEPATVLDMGIIGSGTAQAGSASTIQLAAATSFVDDLVAGAVAVIASGTGAGQARSIIDWVSATDTATVSPNWTTAPDNTSVYRVFGSAPAITATDYLPTFKVDPADLRTALGLATANLDVQFSAVIADTEDLQARTPAALVGGRTDASVGAMANDTLTDAALATDAVAAIGAAIITLLGTPAGASIAADIIAAKGDTAAIKTKTDQLVFTVANLLNVNALRMNGKVVAGDGSSGDKIHVVP